MYSFWQKILDIVVAEFWITLPNIDSCLSNPPKPELWDFAFSCFIIAKELKSNPNEIANKLSQAINKETESFKNASAMWWYVNFALTDKEYINNLNSIQLDQKSPKNETIIVDYIWANVGKPLHIWHLCTPSIWQTIINTYKYLGYNVISDSHFGDWGWIFGKLITMQKLIIRDKGWSTYWKTLELPEHEKLEYKDIFNNRLRILLEKLDEPQNEIIKNAFTEMNILYNKLKDLTSKWEPEPDNDFMNRMYYSYVFVTFLCENDSYIDNKCREEFQLLSWIWINQENKEQYSSHIYNIERWKHITKNSIAASNYYIGLLKIKPQYNIWESFYEWLDLPRPNNEDYPELKYNMKDIVKELLDGKIATQNEDWSVWVVFPDEAKMPSCVLQKKDWTWLYLTSDLAAIKYRITSEWKNKNQKVLPKVSKIIYCVDVRQQLHLKQAFYIAHRAWDNIWLDNTELFHAYNGFIKLKEGAMSTRKWTVIFLKDLIEQWYSRTREILEWKWRKLSEDNIRKITIAAIKYSYLSQDREKDVVFDWNKALNFEWNSWPYIQYAYVRASKVIKEFNNTIRHVEFSSVSIDPESSSGWQISDLGWQELSQFDKSIIKKLSQFEEKVLESANKYKPHIIAQYCYELAGEFNSFYVNTPKILEEKNMNLKNLRLTLIEKTKEVLLKWFELLAMEMPDEM